LDKSIASISDQEREVVQGKWIKLEKMVEDRTQELQAANEELTKVIAEVKMISGLLPICASCKKIRNDEEYWEQIESYIRDHSEAEFSHGICPECLKTLYPELYKKLVEDKI
jgi:hypothetical protein